MALAVDSPVAGIPSERGTLQAVDLLLLGYLTIVSVIMLHQTPTQPKC